MILEYLHVQFYISRRNNYASREYPTVSWKHVLVRGRYELISRVRARAEPILFI